MGPPSRIPEGKVKLAVVTEKPSYSDMNARRHMSGPAGSLLEANLRAADIMPHEVAIVPAVLCPCDTEKDLAKATRACAPRALKELASIDAPIMPLGKGPLWQVLAFDALRLARGFIWRAPVLEDAPRKRSKKSPKPEEVLRDETYALRAALAGRVVLPSLSHTYVLAAETWRPLLALDVKRVGRVLRGEVPVTADEGEHVTGDPSILSDLGPVVSCDIETDDVGLRAKILCIGFSDGERTRVVWPWHDGMAKDLSTFLRTRERVVYHNSGFDVTVMGAHGVTFDGVRVDDTLLVHHAIASHLPQKLDQLVSEVLDSAPWKIRFGRRGKREKEALPKEMPGDELCLYNAADCRVTIKAWHRLYPRLSASDLKVYEHDRALGEICRGMRAYGFALDRGRKQEILGALAEKSAALLATMRDLTARDTFHPGALGEVREFVFRKCKAKPLRIGDNGLPSTDTALLEAYRHGAGPLARFCSALLEWRLVEKVRSTYVDIAEPDPVDGRVHYDWKPFGTVSGRLAGRLQSCPRWSPRDPDTGEATPEGRPRELYVAREGCQLVYFDVSQAEMRLAAFLSADPCFIEACKGDVHAGNARNVFPEIVAKGWLDDPKALKDPERGKPYRDISKNLGFAIAYGAAAERVYLTLVSKGFTITMPAVVTILANLRSRYRVYYAWAEENLARVKRCGYMRTPFLGRIRWFGWHPKPTEIANYPIQGGLADIMNRRMQEIDAACMREGVRAPMLAQVHDACTYEVPVSDVERMRGILQATWDVPIDTPGGSLVLPIDLKVGHRWSEF